QMYRFNITPTEWQARNESLLGMLLPLWRVVGPDVEHILRTFRAKPLEREDTFAAVHGILFTVDPELADYFKEMKASNEIRFESPNRVSMCLEFQSKKRPVIIISLGSNS